MNVFFTNSDPKRCADEHCTVHTRKMIIEYAQMLSTAHRVLDGNEYADRHGLYKQTHTNHPSAKWVRENSLHYCWLFSVFAHLCENYSKASNRSHKTARLLTALAQPPKNIPAAATFSPPPMAMPEEFRSDDVAKSYQDYVNSKYADWTTRTRKIQVAWHIKQPNWVSYELL